MTLLIILIAGTLLISFLCSMSESVVFSSSMSYIETIADKSSGGKLLKKLKTNQNRAVSAILAVNTIANTAGASAIGAQTVAVFGETYLGVISGLLTVMILIFSEIIPKSIGATFWREICVPIGYLVNTMIYIAYPLVLVTEFLTKLFSRKDGQTISREEIAVLTNIGEREGVFESNESKIINNLIKLKSIKVRSIMTPRTVVLAAQEDLTLEEFFCNKDYFRYSRIPVYTDSIDNITGFVLKSDILLHLANNKKSIKLKDIRRDIISCYENTTILRFYDLMITRKEHVALVIDEYGGMEGIVTLEDVIETLLGLEITDEFDIQIDMQQFAKERWKKLSENINDFEIKS